MPSAASTTTCSCTTPPAGTASGADSVSSSITEQPTSSPARSASSTKPAPGNSTVPATAWSPSHGWAAVDSRPVNTTPPESGRSTTAPSNACSASVRPRLAMFADPTESLDSQNRRRTKAYVGNGMRRALSPVNAADQSRSEPVANSCPAADSSESTSGRPLAIDTTEIARSVVRHWSTAAANAAPGPTSKYTPAPSDSASCTPSTNRTGLRTWSTQYATVP